jgi:hypothetical protein
MDMLGFEMGGEDLSKEAEDIIKPIINKIVSDIIDEFPTLKSIKDLEKSRKEFVNVIDKLNYIATYSGDTKIVDTTLVKTPLTGFNQSGFTSNYNVVIDYLRNFDTKTTLLFSSLINFNEVYLESATITNENIKSILQVFLIGHKSKIVDPLVNRWIGDELLQYTTQNFYENFDLFVNSNNTTTLTIDAAPIRSNGTPIEYETSPSTEVTNEPNNEIFKIFSSKNNLGTTLNFYK